MFFKLPCCISRHDKNPNSFLLEWNCRSMRYRGCCNESDPRGERDVGFADRGTPKDSICSDDNFHSSGGSCCHLGAAPGDWFLRLRPAPTRPWEGTTGDLQRLLLRPNSDSCELLVPGSPLFSIDQISESIRSESEEVSRQQFDAALKWQALHPVHIRLILSSFKLAKWPFHVEEASC